MSVNNTARMTARIALDRSVANGKSAFAGDRLSILDATDVIEAQADAVSNVARSALKRSFARHRGSRHRTHRIRVEAVTLAYLLTMLTDQTALSNLPNARYPDIMLERFDQFAKKALPAAVAA